MEIQKIIYRNLLFHKLRSFLTILAAAIALFGFCMIRTLIDAWYSGVNDTSNERMIVRNYVSLIFPLPYSYGSKISTVNGVIEVGFGNWFGGEYKDNKYQFSQFAVSENYLGLMKELKLENHDFEQWKKERKGILIGNAIARKFGLSVGDVMQFKGTIFPGTWDFVVSGIFIGRNDTGDERQCFFHWEYLNERNKTEINRSPDHVGFYSIIVDAAHNSTATIADSIDGLFKNSYAETKTETESEFVKGFVSMSSAIISAMNVISIMVLVIMLLVVTNTVLLSFRERKREYAILRTLGFGHFRIFQIILGESFLLCMLGLGVLSIALTFVFSLPKETLLGPVMDFFPVFAISRFTVIVAFVASLVVALFASIFPFMSLLRGSTAQGLRNNF